MFQNVIGGPVAYAAVLRARGRAGFARRTVLFAVAFERAVEVPKEEAARTSRSAASQCRWEVPSGRPTASQIS
jgi:hypothetical protein